MKKFNKIITEIFKISPKNIKDSMTSKDIPDWDSMNFLMFISELEKEFKVSFSMDEILKADSLGTIKTLLKKKGVDI